MVDVHVFVPFISKSPVAVNKSPRGIQFINRASRLQISDRETGKERERKRERENVREREREKDDIKDE